MDEEVFVVDKFLKVIDLILSTVRMLPELFHLIILKLSHCRIYVIQIGIYFNLHLGSNKNLRGQNENGIQKP